MKRQILGLDISDDFIAAVVVQQSGQEKKVKAAGFMELGSRRQVADVLPSLLQQVDWSGGTCCCGISLTGLSLRNLTVPFTDRKKIGQVLPLELEDQFLSPAGEYVIEYITTAATENRSNILVAGMDRARLREDLGILQQGGANPSWLTLRNVALVEMLIKSGSVPADFLLLESGVMAITMVLVNNGRVVFIRRLPYPDRMLTLAPFSFKKGMAAIAHPEEAMSCMQALCEDIEHSIGYYRLESQADFQPDLVALTGSLSNVEEFRELVRSGLGREVVAIDLQQAAGITLPDTVRDQWVPPLLDHALALGLRGWTKKQTINFRKEEFAPEKLFFFASKAQLIAAMFLVGVVLGGAMVLLGLDHRSLSAGYDDLGERMSTLYRETFPGATRIVDPLVQMQANVREVQGAIHCYPRPVGRQKSSEHYGRYFQPDP